MSFRSLYEEIFKINDLESYIQDDFIDKFEKLTDIMIRQNQVMNVTALTIPEKIIPLHYADCVKIAELIPQNARVLDVGCGGGFPTLPLAIVRPDLKIVGLDSTEKKIRYVQNTANELGLCISTVAGRAEDLAKLPEHRESYDVVVSRAVARLNILNELCLPFVTPGGCFIAMKGAAGSDEYEEAKNGTQKLGGAEGRITTYTLTTTAEIEHRTIVHIQKSSNTPTQYPRAFGAIKKKPL